MPQTLQYLRPLFVEDQGFRLRSIAIVIGVAIAGFVFVITIMSMVGRGTVGLAVIALVGTILLAVPVLIATMKLRIVIDAAGLHVCYFPYVNRTFPLDEIVAWDVMPYDPMEYGGWGVRGFPGRYGWAYNVSGNRGVEIEFKNGNRLMLGSQRAEDLAAAIAEAKRDAT